MTLKFIHAADLHLESPFEGLMDDEIPQKLWEKIFNSTFLAFSNLVQDAINQKVDFVLLSGDLFDRDNQTPKTYNFFYGELDKLNAADIKIFMIFGNHDYLNISASDLKLPNNVYVFGNQVETKTFNLNDKKIAITGFSYENRWINDKMIDNYPVKSNVDFQIGMLHGSEANTGDNYAPFTINDLLDKKYDYWALGHIHKMQQLNANPPIYYSGNIQGRHKNESGSKGYLLINEVNGNLNVSFNETSVIIWDNLTININENNTNQIINDLMSQIYKNKYSKIHLLEITFNINKNLLNINHDELLSKIQNTLREEYDNLNAWVYDIRFSINDNEKISNIDDDIWQEAAESIFTKDNIMDISKSLSKYDFIQNHLDNNIQDNLLKQAKINLLGNKGNIDED
ncbi:DNA repair exonuclease [Apilactobacillus timberlakei]|nr:DNA repair exonuclease [Apilactobacillus timberlakei]TPR18636.1 DNA repair exonuclease [Apilactobacillus timberlakei]TPR20717.1 DNA repair exonuclease [Apilactobacillus timberlakei]TPR21418.1 DNA repair exonuclease [Apilactobacillus timberlakei]